MPTGWSSIQARHDEIARDVEAMRAALARKKPRSRVNAVAMLQELAEGIDQLEANQAARDVRLAAKRNRGMAAYERAREALAGEVPEDRSLTVAASFGIARPGVKVF